MHDRECRVSVTPSRRIAEAGRGMTPLPASAVPPRRRRLVPAALLALAALTMLTACAPGTATPEPTASVTADTPRTVTTSEAELLASVGFQLGRRSVVAVAGTIVDSAGALAINGWLAPEEHRAYAAISAPDGGAFLTLWTPTEIAAQDLSDPMAPPPLPIPADGWQSTALDASMSTLAAGQQLLVSLASDRPDNAQLVMQGRAMYLRQDTVGDTAVTVFAGPLSEGATQSNIRYWIAADGTLLRLEMRLDGVNWSVVDFADEARDVFAGL